MVHQGVVHRPAAVPVVDEERQAEFGGEPDLGVEHGVLIGRWREVAVEVEPRLADGADYFS